ncbi:MAG: hydrogenase iron-sulfur subunit [Euryarchaeota archaeon]|nr:hydrogenase iron-sulfur subunit [Euryarchaeota archaeon]
MDCCHNNDCNVKTEERMGDVIDAMELLGLEGRVHLEWVSASEGQKFRETVTEFVEQIRALGPSPLRDAAE